MKLEELVVKKFENTKETENITDEILNQLMEYRAREKDHEINRKLMKELILKYSTAERKLVELNELKNKFLGIAAHDLRNPITAIMSFSEIIMDEEVGPITEEQKEFLGIIFNSSKFMLGLLNDLLDVSLIESGKLDLNVEKGSLKLLIEERIRINNVIAEKKEIKISFSLEDIPKTFFDSNRLSQVMDNLISNAVKFSNPQTGIYISLTSEEKFAKITVRDEGPGISDEDQEKLFGEFQKLSARPTAGEKSTGLGLAIVKKIIEAHNGQISVKSKLGKGTRFIFTVPLAD